jgi:hypothetical protein
MPVFAPSRVRPLDEVIIQVIVHSPERESEAKRRALNVDRESEPLASVPLPVQLQMGDQLRFTLECSDAWIREPIHNIGWNGRLVCVHFLLLAPGVHQTTGTIRPKLSLFVNGMPAGNVLFKIEIVPFVKRGAPIPANERVQRFQKPFLSYAAEDRVSVLKAAQMLRALNMEYFQDILNLSPGERWEQKLYSEIRNCDVFLLFWSQHARDSQWVIREAEFALACRDASSNTERSPEIVPILLEGPPAPLPPATLSAIHFNDPLRHIIFAEETVAKDNDLEQKIAELPKPHPEKSLRQILLLSFCSLFYVCMIILGGVLIRDGVTEGDDGGFVNLAVGILFLLSAFPLLLELVIREVREAHSK